MIRHRWFLFGCTRWMFCLCVLRSLSVVANLPSFVFGLGTDVSLLDYFQVLLVWFVLSGVSWADPHRFCLCVWGPVSFQGQFVICGVRTLP